MSEAANEPDKFETWAIVELMGHRKLAGLVTEQTVGGQAFVRIDVPEIPASKQKTFSGDRDTPAVPGFTKLYGAGAIYCITPCTEELARKMVAGLQAKPMELAELPSTYRLAGPQRFAEDDESEDDIPY